jgi:G3E family GTPase
MVTVVDALNFLRDYSSTDSWSQRGETAGEGTTACLVGLLLTEQVEFADVVVVNKIDKVDAQSRWPRSSMPTMASVPLRTRSWAPARFDLERASAMPGWARELEGRHTPETEAYGIDQLRAAQPPMPIAPLALFHVHGPAACLA